MHKFLLFKVIKNITNTKNLIITVRAVNVRYFEEIIIKLTKLERFSYYN